MADTRRVLGWAGELDRPGTRAPLSARIDHAGPLQIGVIGLGSGRSPPARHARSSSLGPVTGIPGEALLAPPQRLLTVDVDGPIVVAAEVDLGGRAARDDRPDRPAGAGPGRRRRSPQPSRPPAAADVAVVVVGLTAEQETESVDKTTLALPGAQDALVAAVAAVARRTVVVVNAATPVLMPWARRGRRDPRGRAARPGGRRRRRCCTARHPGADRAAGHHLAGRRRGDTCLVGDPGRRRAGLRGGRLRRAPRTRGRPRAGAGLLVRRRAGLRQLGLRRPAGSTCLPGRRSSPWPCATPAHGRRRRSCRSTSAPRTRPSRSG